MIGREAQLVCAPSWETSSILTEKSDGIAESLEKCYVCIKRN